MNETFCFMESESLVSLKNNAFESLIKNNYDLAMDFYEQLISLDSSCKTNYWYLGLSQLLQGQESNAQMTWIMAIEDAELSQIEQWNNELGEILEKEAQRQESQGADQNALTVRYYLCNVNPYSLHNFIAIILISIKRGEFSSSDLTELGVIDLINSTQFIPLSEENILGALEKILVGVPLDEITTQFLDIICLNHIYCRTSIINKLIEIHLKVKSNYVHKIILAIKILEIGMRLDPQNLEALIYLQDLYLSVENYEKSIKIGRELYSLTIKSKVINKAFACRCLIGALLKSCTDWESAAKIQKEFEIHLLSLIEDRTIDLTPREAKNLLGFDFFSPYFYDRPNETHSLRREVVQLVYDKIYSADKARIDIYKKLQSIRKKSCSPNKPLKIGYLSSSLRRHSVGFLTRWLFKYHDRDQFELYGYFVGCHSSDPIQQWFESQFYKSYTELSDTPADIADQISQDRIDILVDLDSITSNICPSVLALKPAPIQLTWLGWDAAGQSKVDYFIADPYVLPDTAQQYYAEKIWRLPNTFIAVEGFEIGIPTIRRSLLNLPSNAVIFLTAQSAMKRHPNCARLQMKIIKSVPHSYLLIKGMGNQESMKDFFNQIAESEDVDISRLRFLPITNSEEEHRANLGIADIVLDTYPYNGATHTMETLWMGIPMVTRVGEQFAARNSYTMMVNAGISEGIAWTDDEYVSWGVKLGTDINLRQQVSWKLNQGRHTEPLWDAQQFTKDMENAYLQMWAKYLESDEQNQDLDHASDLALFIAEAEIQNAEGITFAHQGKLDAAILSFETAISLDSNLADAYYNLGVAFNEKENIDQALLNFQTAVRLNPNHANGLYNLGLMLVKLGEVERAIDSYSKSLAILPNDVQTHHALGNAFFAQGKWNDAIKCYQSALSIDPNSADIHCSMGAALSEQGHLLESISFLKSAINLNSNDAQAYSNLGNVFSKTKQLAEAIHCYQTALQIKPDLGNAYWNFNNDVLANSETPLSSSYKFKRDLADQFVDNCSKTDKVRSLINSINIYTHSGLGDAVNSHIVDLESTIFSQNDRLNNLEIEALYNSFLFIVSSIRDDSSLNSHLYRFVSELYINNVIKPKADLEALPELVQNHQQIKHLQETSQLRIGFLSPHFARHPVGWCSFDVISELSQITPHIYLYATGSIEPDDRTRLFEQVVEKFYWHENNSLNSSENTFSSKLNKVISEISNDKLDVLIDLDSLTIPLNTHVLYRHLAPLCISWLGFDAPFISSENYCFCDNYTHPSTSDKNYIEKLIRLPNSHMAVSGFECKPINRNQQRDSLGMSSEQIAYLFAAPGRKFNSDTARACVQIIKQVPNSVLLHKGNGDLEVIQSTYQKLCNEQGVDFQRVKFLPSYKNEEEHRSIYSIADIFLDSYPYNGGSHNLEALWFNLPMVTHRGEQSFARMGYSFLQAVGIDQGIANNWDEYIDCGVRYGLDTNLRDSVKQQLIESKKPDHLAALWNPKKLAQDMYEIISNLIKARDYS